MQDYRARFGRMFPLRRFVFTEAKDAIEAHKLGDLERHVQSGLPDLHDLIRRRAHASNRLTSLSAEITKAVADLHELFSRLRPGEKIPWHPSTLARVRKTLPPELIASLT